MFTLTGTTTNYISSAYSSFSASLACRRINTNEFIIFYCNNRLCIPSGYSIVSHKIFHSYSFYPFSFTHIHVISPLFPFVMRSVALQEPAVYQISLWALRRYI